MTVAWPLEFGQVSAQSLAATGNVPACSGCSARACLAVCLTCCLSDCLSDLPRFS